MSQRWFKEKSPEPLPPSHRAMSQRPFRLMRRPMTRRAKRFMRKHFYRLVKAEKLGGRKGDKPRRVLQDWVTAE